jgi:hypothetical protein
MTGTYTEPTAAKTYRVMSAGKQIAKATLRQVPVGLPRIDSAYQRDVSTHWVAQHLPFNERQSGAIVLSLRGGTLFVIDGGHRLALARESGTRHINAFVIEGLLQMDEAGLFVRYQRERRNLTSHALFRADVVRGDADTLAMVRIVNNAGLHLAKTTGDFNITAIDAVRYIQRYGQDDLLIRTLDLVKRIWLGEPKAMSGQVLKGLALFLFSASDDPAFHMDRLEKIMRATGPEKLIRLSQAVAAKRTAATSSASNVAEALHESYQKAVAKPEDRLQPLTIGKKRRPAARGSRA